MLNGGVKKEIPAAYLFSVDFAWMSYSEWLHKSMNQRLREVAQEAPAMADGGLVDSVDL